LECQNVEFKSGPTIGGTGNHLCSNIKGRFVATLFMKLLDFSHFYLESKANTWVVGNKYVLRQGGDCCMAT